MNGRYVILANRAFIIEELEEFIVRGRDKEIVLCGIPRRQMTRKR